MNDNIAFISEKNGIRTLHFTKMLNMGCANGFSTRSGGVSGVPFDTLNMGFNRPEPRVNIMENYRRFTAANGLELDSLVLASYVHGVNVEVVDRKDCGRGVLEGKEPLPACDGLVTNDPEVTLLTLHADCLAYFIFDPINRAAGLAHAGWRGAYGRIGRNLLEAMSNNYGTRPQDVLVGIGPGICVDCYEVGDDVAEKFANEFGASVVKDMGEKSKKHIDIPLASKIQFLDCGVPEESIAMADQCTYEHKELYYSYRRDAKLYEKTGAMCAYMSLKGL